jgi:hypothetical protein
MPSWSARDSDLLGARQLFSGKRLLNRTQSLKPWPLETFSNASSRTSPRPGSSRSRVRQAKNDRNTYLILKERNKRLLLSVLKSHCWSQARLSFQCLFHVGYSTIQRECDGSFRSRNFPAAQCYSIPLLNLGGK